MGLYNNIECKIECEICGSVIPEWQSKNSIVEVKSKSGKVFHLDDSFNLVPIEDVSSGDISGACMNKNCAMFGYVIEKKIVNGLPLASEGKGVK